MFIYYLFVGAVPLVLIAIYESSKPELQCNPTQELYVIFHHHPLQYGSHFNIVMT